MIGCDENVHLILQSLCRQRRDDPANLGVHLPYSLQRQRRANPVLVLRVVRIGQATSA